MAGHEINKQQNVNYLSTIKYYAAKIERDKMFFLYLGQNDINYANLFSNPSEVGNMTM